jgi:hypothetical protein
MVYQQLKVFIAENYRFKDVQNLDLEENCGLISNPVYYSHKQSKNEKIRRFRDYMNSEHFPYKILVLDLNGRCMVCHKIQKMLVFKGESDYFCGGCKLKP